MQRLYEAIDRIEAQMLADLLRSQGIEATILGDYLSGAAGELPALQFPVVWILDGAQVGRARQLLRHFLERGVKCNGTAWCCPHCGEWSDPGFEICWNCATPRD